MKTDLDLSKLARTLRALSYDLDALARKGIPVEDALLDLLALGPRSSYAARRILRRRRETVDAALKRLVSEGKVRRTREGYALIPPGEGEGVPGAGLPEMEPEPGGPFRQVGRDAQTPDVLSQNHDGSREG
jgi:hypothetical protein